MSRSHLGSRPGGTRQPALGEAIRIAPGRRPGRVRVRVPGSKSLTNRALLLAGLACGRSRISGALEAEDTEAMRGALRAIGARIEADGKDLVVDGLAGPPRGPASIDCRMAGTVARFLVPVLAAGSGSFVVDAHPQLRRRPLGPVLEALRRQGASVEGDALPLRIRAVGLSGGTVAVDSSISSQFLSGLAIAAPLARAPTELRFGSLASAPYLELTLQAMRAFGAEVSRAPGAVSVKPRSYERTHVRIEPDVSSASYFLAGAALSGASIELPGIGLATTAQGDIALARHLVAMGARIVAEKPLELAGPERLRGVSVEMGESSDVFMTLACVAPFADGPTTIEGIGHARLKESDRLAAVAENLTRLGVRCQVGLDWLRVWPGEPRPDVLLPTYEDHRIAMAFSLIGLRVPVGLADPAVVAKTFPSFFELWETMGAEVAPW
jgi:3-phosphoshikimate 1-carboxyvinyltransferase